MRIKKIRKNMSRNSVYIITIVFIIVHACFFLSGFLPDTRNKKISAFRQPQELSAYKTISLIRWEYCPKEEVMEIQLDITNNSYSEGDISFSAFDGDKELDSRIVYNRDNSLIIQLIKVKNKKGRRIRIAFAYTQEDKTNIASFYHTIGYIEEADSLPVLSEEAYQEKMILYDIAYYKGLISNNQEVIDKNNQKIEATEREINKLKETDGELTTDEILNISDSIKNNENIVRNLQSQNQQLKKEIEKYQDTIEILERRVYE